MQTEIIVQNLLVSGSAFPSGVHDDAAGNGEHVSLTFCCSNQGSKLNGIKFRLEQGCLCGTLGHQKTLFSWLWLAMLYFLLFRSLYSIVRNLCSLPEHCRANFVQKDDR